MVSQSNALDFVFFPLCDVTWESSYLQTSLQDYGSLMVAGGARFQLEQEQSPGAHCGSFTRQHDHPPGAQRAGVQAVCGRARPNHFPLQGGLTLVSLLQPAAG